MEELLFINKTLHHKLQKPKRRTINLHQSQVVKKTQVINSYINPYDSELQQDMKTNIELQRNKLRTLEKTAAKRIVATAENNLIRLLKSKAQVNCLINKDNIHPFHASLNQTPNATQVIFNDKKLDFELEKQHKYKHIQNNMSSPLIQYCRRMAFLEMKKDNLKENDIKHINKTQYCSFTSQRKRKNNFLI